MTPGGTRVVLVAAVADNGVIGSDGGLPWQLPEDLAHFKATTLGHVLLMGRATYDSIGRPLPGRTTIVLTRDPSWTAPGVWVAATLPDALALADDLADDPADGGRGERAVELMVVGGSAVYAAALPVADVQIITEVHRAPKGDTYYPPFDPAEWHEQERTCFDGYDRVRWARAAGEDAERGVATTSVSGPDEPSG